MENKVSIEQLFAEALIKVFEGIDDELLLLQLLILKWYQLN